MRDKTLLPERQVSLPGLAILCQKGMEVRAFTQKFWTRAKRLGCKDADIKITFNLCLDEPLLQWEMELVKSLDFWNFSRHLQLRQEGKVIHHNPNLPVRTQEPAPVRKPCEFTPEPAPVH